MDVSKSRWAALVSGLALVLGIGAYTLIETPATDQVETEVAEVVEDGAIKEADAQASGATASLTTAEEIAQLERLFQLTGSADAGKQKEARALVRKHMYKALPRYAPHVLGKGGLLGAAGATWTVVGLELYYLPCWECGEESMKLNQEVALSPDAIEGWTLNRDGTVNSQAWVTSYSVNRDAGNNWTASIEADYAAVSPKVRYFADGTKETCLLAPGLGLTGLETLGTNVCSRVSSSDTSVPVYPNGGDASKSGTGSGSYGFDITAGQPTGAVVTRVCGASPATCEGTVNPPTYDVGSISEATEMPEGAFSVTGDETATLYDSVSADLEFNELLEDPWGPDWDQPGKETMPPKDPGEPGPFGPVEPGWPKTDRIGQVWHLFEDGTYGSSIGEDTVYYKGNKYIWVVQPPGLPPVYYYNERPSSWSGGAPVCAESGMEKLVAVYSDGFRREVYYPAGTPTEDFGTVAPECEVWRDSSGNEVAAPANVPSLPALERREVPAEL